MSMDWLKICKDTIGKPEIGLLAERMNVKVEEAFGHWFRLMCWADSNTANGVLPNMTLQAVARLAGVPEAVTMTLADPVIGWMLQHHPTESGKPGGVVFRNWDRHNGTSAKRRAEGARRAAKSRAGKLKRDGNATIA